MKNNALFISFLGTSRYRKTTYVIDNQEYPVRYIQEALLQNATAENRINQAIILCTDQAKKSNWDGEANGERIDQIFVPIKERMPEWEELAARYNLPVNTKISTEGESFPALQKLTKEQFPELGCRYETIPDGNNEQELMEIFSLIYELIPENSAIELDITHSFRHLPMLMSTLLPYLKLLKNVQVNHIHYGNYEARDKDERAPVLDLLPFITIQQYTAAAHSFIVNGSSAEIQELAAAAINDIKSDLYRTNRHKKDTPEWQKLDRFSKEIKPLMKKAHAFVQNARLCRGNNILKTDAAQIVLDIEKENTALNPLLPLLERMNMEFAGYSENSFLNLLRHADWCFKHRHYQQAITQAVEYCISVIAADAELDCHIKENRNSASSSAKIAAKEIPKEEWHGNIEKIQKCIETDACHRYKDILQRLQPLRNDINHSGLIKENGKPTFNDYEKLAGKLGKKLNELFEMEAKRLSQEN